MAPTLQTAAAFERCQRYFATQASRPLAFRKAQLKKLYQAVQAFEGPLCQALYQDLHKSPAEAYMTEIGFLLTQIRHTLRHLDSWARERRVPLPPALFPARGRIVREPYGTALIIAPFNYPVQLLLSPLIGAIAGGNCAVVKPSEMAPATSRTVAELIQSAFPPEYVCCLEGDASMTQALLQHPFSLIFFTGGQRVGRLVMEAAARSLSPVVLELGGKSPAIVDETADLSAAAKRIIWGKTLNAGQTCVAPDYCLCQRAVYPALVRQMQKAVTAFYGPDPKASPDYGRIINSRHFHRLEAMLNRDKDFLLSGGETDRGENYIAPTLLGLPTMEAACMEDEIFGPILPVIPYDTVEDCLAMAQLHPNPLAVYLFTRENKRKRQFLCGIPSGGACINDTVEHLAAPNLPFGGVGTSGMGAYHGRVGFETFTHGRAILEKAAWPRIEAAFPPYGERKLRLVRKLMK